MNLSKHELLQGWPNLRFLLVVLTYIYIYIYIYTAFISIIICSSNTHIRFEMHIRHVIGQGNEFNSLTSLINRYIMNNPSRILQTQLLCK